MPHERFHFSDRAALERRAAELGLDIPLSDDISCLFSRVYLPGKTLLNRFVVLPMEGADAEPSGGPSDLTLRRYKRFAEGGSAAIWFEATAVAAEARSNPHQLWIRPETKTGFRRLVKETRLAAHRKFGHDHDLLFILQLTHSGRFAKPDGSPAPIVAQPNPVLDAGSGFLSTPHLISDSDLDALQDRFAAAAGLAAEAGFDGVDIKACHGYLVSELLGACDRTDSRYGGGFENRIRFLVETSQKIRGQFPGLIVTSRLNVFDAIPRPYGFGVDIEDAERPDLGEPVELVRRLVHLGYPLIGISLGVPAHRSHFGRPYDKPLIGQALPDEHPLAGVARWLRLTAEIQKVFPSLPVVGAGYSCGERKGIAHRTGKSGSRLPRFGQCPGGRRHPRLPPGLPLLFEVFPDAARGNTRRLRRPRHGDLPGRIQTGQEACQRVPAKREEDSQRDKKAEQAEIIR
jgi:2,4-dienoyl-CoA reductase (NADPH2)